MDIKNKFNKLLSSDNKDSSEQDKHASDVERFGDTGMFRILCSISSEKGGWEKSTRICNVFNGCIMKVSSKQRNPDGSYALAESITFIPGMNLYVYGKEDRRLLPIK